MKRWLHIAPDYWRKDVDLPLGHVVAEIQKRDGLPLYTTRVQVTFVEGWTPQCMVKSDITASTLETAQEQCEALLAEWAALDFPQEVHPILGTTHAPDAP